LGRLDFDRNRSFPVCAQENLGLEGPKQDRQASEFPVSGLSPL
jgi:hypothetical protein